MVCVAGRNQQVKSRLEATFAGEPRLTVLGFTTEMNELLAASDVVIHTTGGVTYLEALVKTAQSLPISLLPGTRPSLPRTLPNEVANRRWSAKPSCRPRFSTLSRTREAEDNPFVDAIGGLGDHERCAPGASAAPLARVGDMCGSRGPSCAPSRRVDLLN